MSSRPVVYLLDAHYQIFRAYHSLPDLRAPDGATGERSGPKEIEARIGVPPELVADYLALVGDATDNIPGVRGIGARTASALLRQLGSIESVPRDPALWEELGIRGAKREGLFGRLGINAMLERVPRWRD